jgi:PKD repeat protein
VKLTASNASGSGSTTVSVTVKAPVVVPVASSTASYAGVPLTEQLVDTSTGSPTSWSWNFGDQASGLSNTTTAKNPVHRYSKTGTYTVTLTVRNAAGSGSASSQLTVYRNRLVVSATIAPSPILVTRN